MIGSQSHSKCGYTLRVNVTYLGVVCPSCTFYHDPLRHYFFYLVKYKAHIHILASNSFSERVHITSKPYDLK